MIFLSARISFVRELMSSAQLNGVDDLLVPEFCYSVI